jgi:hypothetical protein
MKSHKHFTDEELLCLLDGEGGSEEAIHCWQCRVRMGELEKSIASFVHLKREKFDVELPSGDGPASLLRARMKREKPGRRYGRWVAVGLVFGLLLLLPGRRSVASYLPDHRVTPGATRLVSRDQVCVLSASVDDRKPSLALAMQVFDLYGIRNPQPRSFEVDYLIAPTLGGADDVRNLWPQPYRDSIWNSRVKDALEDLLRAKVCQGEMDLASAQAEIAKNWVAAYQKHFRTAVPIEAHALFVKDKPWE